MTALLSPLRSPFVDPLRGPTRPGAGGGTPPPYVGNDLTLDIDLLALDADTLTLE